MLRRRTEVLQNFLTPDEPELEEEFFRKKHTPQEEQPEDPSIVAEPSETTEIPDDNAIQWGTASE